MNANYPQLIDPINLIAQPTFSPYTRSGVSDNDRIYYTYNYHPMNLTNPPPTNLFSSPTIRRVANANTINTTTTNNNYDVVNPVTQNISMDPRPEYIYANRLYDRIYPDSPLYENVAGPAYGMNATGSSSFGSGTTLPLVPQPPHGHPISSDTADTTTRSRAEIQTDLLYNNTVNDVLSPSNHTTNVWSPTNNHTNSVWSPGPLFNHHGLINPATCPPASPSDRANVAPAQILVRNYREEAPAQLSPDYYPFPSHSGIPGPHNPAHSVGTFTDPYLPHDFELDMAAVDFQGGHSPHIHHDNNATSTSRVQWLNHTNHAFDGNNVRHEVIPWHDGDDTFDMFDILGDSEHPSLIFNNNRLGSNSSHYDSRHYHT